MAGEGELADLGAHRTLGDVKGGGAQRFAVLLASSRVNSSPSVCSPGVRSSDTKSCSLDESGSAASRRTGKRRTETAR